MSRARLARVSRALRYDVVVIGCGTAGLVAATRLAQTRRARLSDRQGLRVDAPGAGDDRHTGRRRCGDADQLVQGHGRFRPAPRIHVRRRAHGRASSSLPTAAGALKHSLLVPSTQAPGALAGPNTKVAIVGTPWLRDFQAGLCAANLRVAGLQARAVEFDWRLDRADANAVNAAHSFDDPRWRERFCDGAAAAAGRRTSSWSDSRPCSACATRQECTPTSNAASSVASSRSRRCPRQCPGMRLFEILRSALRKAGGRFVLGAEVVERAARLRRPASSP